MTMPRGIGRPCLSCGALISLGGSRCTACQAEYQRRRDAIRGTPAQRGYDYAYQRTRKAVLAASGGHCAYCGGAATTVDHLLPLARGGTSDASNLVACCSSCNSARGGRMRRR
jgi:5-methylcytosine-specific restriction endonuclease McrA